MDRSDQRKAGLAVACALAAMKKAIDEGERSTLVIDRIGHETLLKNGANPSCLGYKPTFHHEAYKYATCISINEEIVHGVPGDGKFLKAGDVVKLDIVGECNGWHADAAITVGVEKLHGKAQKLIKLTEEALWRGIAAAELGKPLGRITWAIQQYARMKGLGIADGLCGHGIGQEIHCEPAVPNRGPRSSGPELYPGLSISVEPMLTLGTDRISRGEDGWVVLSADGSLAAHFEHTILLTENGVEILTPWHEMLENR